MFSILTSCRSSGLDRMRRNSLQRTSTTAGLVSRLWYTLHSNVFHDMHWTPHHSELRSTYWEHPYDLHTLFMSSSMSYHYKNVSHVCKNKLLLISDFAVMKPSIVIHLFLDSHNRRKTSVRMSQIVWGLKMENKVVSIEIDREFHQWSIWFCRQVSFEFITIISLI